MELVRKVDRLTVARAMPYFRNTSAAELAASLNALTEAGLLRAELTHYGTLRYRPATQAGADADL